MTSAPTRLRRLYESEWAWRIAELGNRSMALTAPVDDFLPDVSEAAQQARLRRWEEVAAELAAIPVDELDDDGRVDHEVYAQQIATLIERQRFRMYERPANADTAFWTELSARAERRFTSADEARRYLRQLADVPRYFEQQVANMRRGLERGFGPPKVTMTGREIPVRTVAEASSATEVAYYGPFLELPPAVDPDTAAKLRAEARSVIENSVLPAYRHLYDFLVDEYLPGLPEPLGAELGPDGLAFYRAQLREFTTTDLEPREIYEIGMREVERIDAEMADVAAEVGYAGDVPGLLAYMRTSPEFYATTPEQLLKEAAWHAKKFDGKVHRYFGRVPRRRFAIVEPPPDIAPYYTFGRGAPERYTLNTYNLPARPLYSLPALTLHEAAPGHSFQTSFALEESSRPAFRQQVYISAFGEGWGLYCERLGVEMGMCETPYEVMGMLSFQMWRAARLVIDPGVHALGWSREQAQDFLREHTAIAEHEIVTEVDRYIAWPGQATSYYLGQLKILELRSYAEQELGASFDLRAFHDLVLSLGSVPLHVLAGAVQRFVAGGGRSPYADER